MSTDLAVLICSVCKGARWVCAEHPLAPWHVGHQHCESHGTPCGGCNPGPEFAPWSANCLACTTPEAFVAANPDDTDVILAQMENTGSPAPSLPSLRQETTLMTAPTTRTEQIEQYFRAKLTRCAGVALPLNRKRWDYETDASADPLHHPYGWMAPTLRPPSGPFVFPFCAAIIDEQTSDLSDDELDEYLETVGFCVSMHIQHYERSPEDRERLIDRTLYDIGPGSMALLSRVQMKAMDARTEGP